MGSQRPAIAVRQQRWCTAVGRTFWRDRARRRWGVRIVVGPMSEHGMQIVPNAGWDQRIWAFQYKRVVTAYAVVSSRYVVLIHISVYVPSIKTVFAGDAAEVPLPFVSNGHSLAQLRASLQRLLALEPATVFSCHAPGSYSPNLLRANIAYFDKLESMVAAAWTVACNPP